MKEKKELNNEQTNKVEGGAILGSLYNYRCLNESCKRKWTSSKSNVKKCSQCGSTNIEKY